MTAKDTVVRDLTDEDMVEIVEWFKERKWRTPPASHALPGTAFVAERNGKLLSVVWLYVTNSGVGILDWVATNPEAGASGIVSLKKVLKYIETVVGDKMSTFIHFTHNDKLAKFFNKKCGYKNDGKVNISIKVLERS